MSSRIVNTYEQLKAAVAAGFDKRRAIAIAYYAPDRSNSRDVSVAAWKVFSPFFQTDPKAAWYDHGAKSFAVGLREGAHKQRKESALKEAMEWAAQFGVTEWAKNRRGDYVCKEVNDNFPILVKDLESEK